jgi:hypothetical protein
MTRDVRALLVTSKGHEPFSFVRPETATGGELRYLQVF